MSAKLIANENFEQFLFAFQFMSEIRIKSLRADIDLVNMRHRSCLAAEGRAEHEDLEARRILRVTVSHRRESHIGN